MMTWDYRVVRREVAGEAVLSIHEVYYNGRGRPVHCTVEAVAPQGATLAELRRDLVHYRQALRRPVLDAAEIGARRRPLPRHKP